MKSFQTIIVAITAFMATTVLADTLSCTTAVKCDTVDGGAKTDIPGSNYYLEVLHYGSDASCPDTTACNGFKTSASAAGTPKCKSYYLGKLYADLDGITVTGWLSSNNFYTCKLDEKKVGQCTC